MGWISLILLILVGVLAATNFIVSKLPQAEEYIGKISPFSGWIGVAATVWGVISLLFWLISIGALFAAPISMLISLAGIAVLLGLGLLLGGDKIKELASNEKVDELHGQVTAPIAPLTPVLGLAALGLAAFSLITLLFVGGPGGGGSASDDPFAHCDKIKKGNMIEYKCPEDNLEMAEGLEKRGTEIIDPTRGPAYIRSNAGKWVSVDMRGEEWVAFNGSSRIGAWRDSELVSGIILRGKIHAGKTWHGSDERQFTMEREGGKLLIKQHPRVIGEVLSNGVIMKDGVPWGQIANIDPYRPTDMMKLFTIAFLYTDLFK